MNQEYQEFQHITPVTSNTVTQAHQSQEKNLWKSTFATSSRFLCLIQAHFTANTESFGSEASGDDLLLQGFKTTSLKIHLNCSINNSCVLCKGMLCAQIRFKDNKPGF